MRLSRTITAPTASRGHVERVATSWAMRIKYSFHEGRTFFRASREFEVSTAGPSKGSIESVSGVAEAGDVERAVVQFRVDGGGVEGHVGVLAGNPFDARHGSDSVEARDLLDLRLGQGRADLDLAGWHVPCGLGDQDQGELLHGLPEAGGRCPLVAEDREL